MDWSKLDKKFSLSKVKNSNNFSESRDQANLKRMDPDLNEDEKFYLNYIYYTSNYVVDPIEKTDFMLQSANNEYLTLETRALAEFSLINILGAHEGRVAEIYKKIEEHIEFKHLTKILNQDDKRIAMLEIMYTKYPTIDNTVYLLYYLTRKYENSEDDLVKRETERKINQIDFPVDQDIYPYLKYKRDYGKRYRILVSINYLQTILKLTNMGILDKREYIEKYKFYLDVAESSLENKNSSEYLKSSLYYTRALYKLYEKDEAGAKVYLDKLLQVGQGDQPMNFIDFFRKEGSLEKDSEKFREVYQGWPL